MKLSQLVAVEKDVEITGISVDSRNVKKGNLFICIKGEHYDGHDYVMQALEKGAVAVVTQRRLGVPGEIVLPDTRRAAASIYSAWYHDPQNDLKVFGVTGTNGKTSVVNILNSIYTKAGYLCGTSGTLGSFWCGKSKPSENTTDPPELLYETLRNMADDGVEYLFTEVSSHSLALERVSEISFECGIYTNLTQDHLDFHGTMENYACAKAKLFEQCKLGIFNYDDINSYIASQNCSCRACGYGKSALADYRVTNILKDSLDGIAYKADTPVGSLVIESHLSGEFNIMNTLAAAAAAVENGIDPECVVRAISDFRGVPGRLEKIYNSDYTVIIDYAHTPDALARTLGALCEYAGKDKQKRRMRVLFGCGGDRDRGKRPLMGEIAEGLSDEVIVTSDNPRSEPPLSIIDDILAGMKKKKGALIVEPDRKKALEYVIDSAQKGDIILVAGKGHETYQIDASGKHAFLERGILLDRISRRNCAT